MLYFPNVVIFCKVLLPKNERTDWMQSNKGNLLKGLIKEAFKDKTPTKVKQVRILTANSGSHLNACQINKILQNLLNRRLVKANLVVKALFCC